MGNGYGVTTADVRNHASSFKSGVVDRVHKAADAGDQVKLGNDEAFGKLLVHVLPPIIRGCVGDAVKGLNSAADAGDAMHEALNKISQNYDRVEKDMAGLIDKIANDGLLR
jgi:hypothetical protein